jgi:hypothetical protein
MPSKITDEAAVLFMGKFYGAIANVQPYPPIGSVRDVIAGGEMIPSSSVSSSNH